MTQNGTIQIKMNNEERIENQPSEKLAEWKHRLNMVIFQEYLLRQNLEIYFNKQDSSYKEHLEYAISNIKQLQEAHKKLDIAYEQAFNYKEYRETKRQKRN